MMGWINIQLIQWNMGVSEQWFGYLNHFHLMMMMMMMICWRELPFRVPSLGLVSGRLETGESQGSGNSGWSPPHVTFLRFHGFNMLKNREKRDDIWWSLRNQFSEWKNMKIATMKFRVFSQNGVPPCFSGRRSWTRVWRLRSFLAALPILRPGSMEVSVNGATPKSSIKHC